jgi:hypothetical protein
MMRVGIAATSGSVSIGKTPEARTRKPAFLGQGRVASCPRLARTLIGRFAIEKIVFPGRSQIRFRTKSLIKEALVGSRLRAASFWLATGYTAELAGIPGDVMEFIVRCQID